MYTLEVLKDIQINILFIADVNVFMQIARGQTCINLHHKLHAELFISQIKLHYFSFMNTLFV